jgi:16S rRNA (guanine(527)-N(7))-methyltransferase RsmG
MVEKIINKKSRGRDKAEGPGPGDMERILVSCGIRLAPDRIALLWKYHNLLRQANPELNLTRIHRFENMVVKLYADSILPATLLALPSPLLDLGTGPGMPGIPLKIAYPDTQIVLAETRQNRVAFLEQTISELDLSGISVYGHAVTPAYEQMFSGVITRAVEHMDKTLHRVRGCLKTGGLVVFMKGPGCADEIAAAQQAFAHGFRLYQDTAYSIPGTPHQRRLVVFERTDAPPAHLRRQAARKHKIRDLESARNPVYKDLKKLLTARGIKKHNQALVSGTKQIHDIIAGCAQKCLAWISASENQPPPEALPGHAAWYPGCLTPWTCWAPGRPCFWCRHQRSFSGSPKRACLRDARFWCHSRTRKTWVR